MTLNSLSQLGKVEKEFEILKDVFVKLHTLPVSEQQNALMDIPETVKDEAVRFMYLQQSILSRATTSVNGEVKTLEQLRSMYSEMQYPLLTLLFTKYIELADEQNKVIEDLKKK